MEIVKQTKWVNAVERAKDIRKNAMAKKAYSILTTAAYYLVILSLSFVFLYPLFYMIAKSLMQSWDVADATVQWVPKRLNLTNFGLAFEALHYWRGFTNSVIISFGSAVLQILSCAVVGYGFARYRFPGHSICLGLVVFTFLVPPQTIVVPLYMFFSNLGWINTHWPFVVPPIFGHGLKGALFVLIFIQFFRRLPNVLEEAARIDGAGPFRTFWMIMFPLAKPAMLVVFLFSVVWHWNDLFQPNLYLLVPNFYNLAQSMATYYGNANVGTEQMSMLSSADSIGMPPTMMNQMMAGMLLTVLPILILYLFLQRHFVESVERSGIAGE